MGFVWSVLYVIDWVWDIGIIDINVLILGM